MTSTLRQGVAVRALNVSGRVMAVFATLSLGACAQIGEGGISGLLGGKEPETQVSQASAAPTSELEKATAYWAKEAARDPKSGKAALSYARNLKALGRKQEALAALQASYLFNSENREFLSEYGRLALDLGQVNTAAQLLEQADDPAKPDWRVISARGTAMAKQGQYKESIAYFERARELAPEQASVLNNLAMAYTMDGQAERAEELLRQASRMGKSDPRVQQNLAMVLSLQGKSQSNTNTAEDAEPRVTKVAAASNGLNPAEALAAAAEQQQNQSSNVSGAVLDPDEIMKAAMKAEAAKNNQQQTPTKPAKKKTAVASNNDAPTLKPAAR